MIIISLKTKKMKIIKLVNYRGIIIHLLTLRNKARSMRTKIISVLKNSNYNKTYSKGGIEMIFIPVKSIMIMIKITLKIMLN